MKRLLLVFAILLQGVNARAEDTWTPFQFDKGQYFKYRIATVKSDAEHELGHFSIKVLSKEGADLTFEWTLEESDKKFTNKFQSNSNQISGKILVSMMTCESALAELIAENLFAPTLEMQYRNLHLKEGEVTQRRGGAAELSVGESETIAGRNGFKVSYREKDALIFVHIIDKDAPLPLSVLAYGKDEQTILCQLVTTEE